MPISRSPLDQIRSAVQTTTGDAIIETLCDWGIEYVFGIPGDNIDGLMNGLYKHRDRINFVLVRHEENAAFMATAYAKLTGKMAACLAISGPGAAHLTNGLYEAHRDKIPLLALTGNTETFSIGTDQSQEYNPHLTFGDCSVWTCVLSGSKMARVITSSAIRAAYARSGPSVLSVPSDLSLERLPKGAARADSQFSRRSLIPDPGLMAQAIERLNRCERPVLLVGRGCHGLEGKLIALADRIGAPIIKSLWGKDCVSDFQPHVLGGIGLLGTRSSFEAMAHADCLLMLGTSFPYNDFLPQSEHCVTIQIDQDPFQIGKRYKIDLGVCADVHLAVPLLVEQCQRHDDRIWLEHCQKARDEWNALMERQAYSDRMPMRPQVMARALQECADEDAIITTDSGANTVWMARNFFVNGQQRFIGSGLMGTMQCGLPYAIGAKFACPDSQVIAAVGDGDFVMSMGEFTTAVANELPIVVCIFNNGKLGLIKYEEEVAGVPEFGVHFKNPDFAKFAEACGGFGIRVEDPNDAVDAVQAAIDSGKPAIIDAIVEPNEVPFPPKIQKGQATGFGIAFLREVFERIRE